MRLQVRVVLLPLLEIGPQVERSSLHADHGHVPASYPRFSYLDARRVKLFGSKVGVGVPAAQSDETRGREKRGNHTGFMDIYSRDQSIARADLCSASVTRTVVNPASCSSASMLPASEKYTSRYGSVLRKMEKSI